MSSKYGNSNLPLTYRNYKEPLTKVAGGHGYYGVIAESEDKQWVQCHECGILVKSLSHHAKKHDMNSVEYRDKYGLGRTLSIQATSTRTLKQEVYKKTFPKKSRLKAIEGLRKYREDVAAGKRSYVNGSKVTPLEKKNRMGTCPDQLLDRLVKIAVVEGKQPGYRFMAKKHGGLLRSILTTYGSFRKAIVLAGLQDSIDYDTRKFTKQQLVELLQIFYKEHGRSPVVSDFRSGQLPDYNTYHRIFGGISQARAAAKIPNQIIRSDGSFVEVA